MDFFLDIFIHSNQIFFVINIFSLKPHLKTFDDQIYDFELKYDRL